MPQHPALIVLDPAARDADAEHELLRAQGPAARIDILGVEAWSVSDPVLLKQLLTSPEVSKDGRRHWPGFHPPRRPPVHMPVQTPGGGRGLAGSAPRPGRGLVQA